MPRRRQKTAAAVRIQRERAACNLCRELADCAVFVLTERNDVVICASCCLAGAAIASSDRRRKRPHKAPCSCAECCAWSRGQLPDVDDYEVARVADVSDGGLADSTRDRARGLEIDA